MLTFIFDAFKIGAKVVKGVSKAIKTSKAVKAGLKAAKTAKGLLGAAKNARHKDELETLSPAPYKLMPDNPITRQLQGGTLPEFTKHASPLPKMPQWLFPVAIIAGGLLVFKNLVD